MAQIDFNVSKFKNKHLLLSLRILPALMDNIKQQLDQEWQETGPESTAVSREIHRGSVSLIVSGKPMM